MAIGDLLWPKEISYGHRKSPMAMGDLLWPWEISYGHGKSLMAIGNLAGDVFRGSWFFMSGLIRCRAKK